MSQPKRYSVAKTLGEGAPFMVESDIGGFVSYSDYAALAAENERLKFEVECIQRNYDFMTGEAAHRLSEVLRLEDENERLRKLLEMYLKADPLIDEAVASAMLAAKEGDRK